MSLAVVLTGEAKADIVRAARWYRDRSMLAAERFVAEVGAAMQRVGNQPTAQPVIDAITGTRRVLVRRFPYRLLYLVERDRAVVLAVVHVRRDESSWRERLE